MDVDSSAPVALRREALVAALAPFRSFEGAGEDVAAPEGVTPRLRVNDVAVTDSIGGSGPEAMRPEALRRALVTLALWDFRHEGASERD